MFEATACPVFTVYRRFDHTAPDRHEHAPPDEERVALMLELLRHGSAGFDLELDCFDPQPGPAFVSDEGLRYSYDSSSPPREISEDPEAARRQREVVEQAHALGGEVILSAHALGSLLVYCRETYSPGSFLDQPLIANAKAVLANVDATIALRADGFLPPELRR